MMTARIQIEGEAHKIGPGKQSIERGHLDSGFCDEGRGNLNNIIPKDLHSKRPGAASNRLADGTNPDYTQSILAQGPPRYLFPAARLHFIVHPGLLSCKGQYITQDGV